MTRPTVIRPDMAQLPEPDASPEEYGPHVPYKSWRFYVVVGGALGWILINWAVLP